MVHLRFTGVSEDGRSLLLVSDAGVDFTVDVDDRLRAALNQSSGGSGTARPVGDADGLDPSPSRHPGADPLRGDPGVGRPGRGDVRRQGDAVRHAGAGRARPRGAARPAGLPAPAARRRRRLRCPDPRRGGGQPPAGPQRRPRHRRLGRVAPRGRPLDPDRLLHDRRPGRRSALLLRRTRQLRRRRRRRRPLAARRARRRGGRRPTRPQPPSTTSRTARRRRLSAVPPEELPLGEDALELVNETPDPDLDTASARAEEALALEIDGPSDADDTGNAENTGDPEGTDDSHHPADAEATGDDDHSHEPPSRKPVKKTRGRASVPSWDEIMFGGSGSQD